MTRDRYSTITISGRTFDLVIPGDDKHDWRLLNASEQSEFDRLWSEMEAEMRHGRAACIVSCRKIDKAGAA
jgi:hypothetical protein